MYFRFLSPFWCFNPFVSLCKTRVYHHFHLSESALFRGAETRWVISAHLFLYQCVSGQVKGFAVTVTHSLWTDLKLCVWDAGSQGHSLSPVPTTLCLCPPPSINRDSHSYIPPIHQSSQHITMEKKRERELACYKARLANFSKKKKQQGFLRLVVIFDPEAICLLTEMTKKVPEKQNKKSNSAFKRSLSAWWQVCISFKS